MAATAYQGDPTAVMGRRIGAYLIDGLLAIVLMSFAVVPMFQDLVQDQTFPTADAAEEACRAVNRQYVDDDDQFGNDSGSSVNISLTGDDPVCIPIDDTAYYLTGNDLVSVRNRLYLASFAVGILNLVVLQGLTGASVGKFATGIRVVRQDGKTANIGWAALRWILLVVDGFCCIVGLIVASTSKGHRRVGDMAAGTLVVRSDAVGSPIQVPGLTAGPAGYPPYPGGPAPGAPGGWAAPPTGQAPAASAWGSPPAGGTWTPPGGDATSVAPAATPSADGPTWDAARNAYIQFDPAQGSWVQWDDATSTWKPISQ